MYISITKLVMFKYKAREKEREKRTYCFLDFIICFPFQIDALQEVLEKLRNKEIPLEKKLGWLPSVSKQSTDNPNNRFSFTVLFIGYVLHK